MPGPLIAKPQIPAWADPQGASVFDVPGQGLLRKVVGLLGLDDPNQVMAFGTPLEVGANTGGVLDALAQRFPRFANAIKAYHGSPHDFEKFDTSKIGTGEGAQAYGHGLYFAENPQVAEDYRQTLSHRDYAGYSTSHLNAQNVVNRFSGDADYAASVLRENIAQAAPNDPNLARLKATLDMITSGDYAKPLPRVGKTYEVAIKAHPDQFLDWDKPLSQQSAAVQKAFADVGALTPTDGMELAGGGKLRVKSEPDFGPKYFLEQGGKQFRLAPQDVQALIGTGVEGKSAYQALVNKLGSQTAATESLKQAGIPGLKYLDQGSRGAQQGLGIVPPHESSYGKWTVFSDKGQNQYFETEAAARAAMKAIQDSGSRNYVVFDDATVEILRKYGILPPVVGATLAGQQANQQPQP